MKPGDHPEFFRMAAPAGTSRESSIRLDAEGRFWHDGELVQNEALAAALHSWIRRHPEDGRYILSNGYDWTYFQVDDVPYQVKSVRLEAEAIVLKLSDGTEEEMRAEGMRQGAEGALYVRVKGGGMEARFSRYAQTQLGEAMEEEEGETVLKIGGGKTKLPV